MTNAGRFCEIILPGSLRGYIVSGSFCRACVNVEMSVMLTVYEYAASWCDNERTVEIQKAK